MSLAKWTRSTTGTAAIAVGTGIVALRSDDVERVVLGAVSLLAAGLSAAMLYRPGAFFVENASDDVPQRRRARRVEEFSPLPTTVFEWVVFVILAALAVLVTVALASGSTGPAVLVTTFAAYCLLVGRFRLRGGHSHRDRFLFLFGELVVAASLIGLLLQPIVP